MKLIIHGGFFSESATHSEMKIAKQKALQRILKNSFEYLKNHTAFETVIHAVEQLEDDELFNAGKGSQIQSDGKIRMSAAIMDGNSKNFSGVINIENVKKPIRIAEKLINFDDRVLGGEGANQFAEFEGFSFYDPKIPQRVKEYESKIKGCGSGTVGCVALDQSGNIAAATSTGGKGFEMVGRISDSATIAGNYANEFCGVSCTGVGEDIVSGAVATKIGVRVSDGFSLEAAFKKTFNELAEFDGFAGAIALDQKGNFFHQDSHPTMVYASYDGEVFDVFS